MTVQLSLATERPPRRCYEHQDRPAAFVRVEKRTKPIESTYRIPQCLECADRRRHENQERQTLGVFPV